MLTILLDVSREQTPGYSSRGAWLLGLGDKTITSVTEGLWSRENQRENNSREMSYYFKEASEIIQEKILLPTHRVLHGVFKYWSLSN